MKTLKLTLAAVIAATVLAGCCTSVPTCGGPKAIMDVSPTRIQGACKPQVNKSWGCGNSYNCADCSTNRLYL